MTKRTSETDKKPQEAARQSTNLTFHQGWTSKPIEAGSSTMKHVVAGWFRHTSNLRSRGVKAGADGWFSQVLRPDTSNFAQLFQESDPCEEWDSPWVEAEAEQWIKLIFSQAEEAHQHAGAQVSTEKAVERNPDPSESTIIVPRAYQTDPGGEEKIGRFPMTLATKRLTSLPPLVDLDDDGPSVSDLIIEARR